MFCIKYNTNPKDIKNTNEPQQYGEYKISDPEPDNSLVQTALRKPVQKLLYIKSINNKNNNNVWPIFNSINETQKYVDAFERYDDEEDEYIGTPIVSLMEWIIKNNGDFPLP